jgi:hypothetical protein
VLPLRLPAARIAETMVWSMNKVEIAFVWGQSAVA